MSSRMTLARLVRLCLKELRESLRDRRTIVTLVLMPLLVYPLLSLVLNRVLLTSVTADKELMVTFGIGSELKEHPIVNVLGVGLELSRDRRFAPVFTEEVVQDRNLAAGKAKASISAIPKPQLMYLADEGRAALRNGSVDLVITRKAPESDLSGGSPSESDVLKSMIEKNAITSQGTPIGFNAEKALDMMGLFEIRYRQGDSNSEKALMLLERIINAVNNEASHELLGSRYTTPFRLLVTPVAMKSNYADLLATMVPLVLVLMTMAGAVYPAIDLTAGERERGTMEALIVSPTPTAALLFAKYSAVVTVALLTALANLAAMTVTLWVSGIGKLIFGDDTLSVGVIGTILVLLVLFTMFFAALLLAVTSFAKSFKEAQAYLIPLMLLALTPGVMSLLPGIKFTELLATVPLVNIVLLARQILIGDAQWNVALIAVICNGIYALAALAVASRLFGSDASMQGSQGSWKDLLLRPRERSVFPRTDQMAITMAVMFPLYFVASTTLPSISDSLSVRLWTSAAVSFLLILGTPFFVAIFRKIELVPTFRLNVGAAWQWSLWVPAILLVGGAAWMAAHEIFIAGQLIGIGTINEENFDRVAEFRDELGSLPLWMVLIVFAATPAICEEFLFRGFVLSSLNKLSATWAIIISAMLFGLMHVLTSNMLAIERFLPSTFMGLILGFVALRCGSIWPGILLHGLHNGLLLTLSHYQEWLSERNILVQEGSHLPLEWLAGGGLAFVVGMTFFALSGRKKSLPIPLPSDPVSDPSTT